MAEAEKNNDIDEKTMISTYNYDRESIIQNSKKELPTKTETESNLQTPLMFSRSSSLCSLSGFDQHSVHDDHSSVLSDFSTRTSGIMSPTSEFSKSFSKLTTSQNSAINQGNQQKSQYNENVPIKRNQSQVKIQVFDDMSFQYDSAFKKPHFMKHSVFEDDIAAFKDESSPNVLSTAASSLSSLTIDDDEYGENVPPNKAGLIKKKYNQTNVLHIQKTNVQENWHQNPLGATHVSLQNSSNIQSAQMFNTLQRLSVRPAENHNFSESLHKFTNTVPVPYDEQSCWESHKPIKYPEHFSNDIKKSNMHFSSNQYKDKQRASTEGEICKEETFFRTNSSSRNQQMTDLNNSNKQINRLIREQDNRSMREHDSRLMREQDSRSMREQDELRENEEFLEGTKGPDPRRPIKEVNHQVDEVDLNAYEEALLDQCIRKGMAKVTKRNMSDIKPFCWDLNHICLTTRALLKTRDEELLKEKKDERNKRRISYKGLSRRLSNSRVK